MTTVKLNKQAGNDRFGMDIEELVGSRLLVQANSGGGKSYMLRVLAEKLIGKVPVVILDPEGEFLTLREKHDVLIVGREGEIDADPRSAGLLARKIAALSISTVVDLSDMNLADRRRFVRLFLESLMQVPKKYWKPLVVIIDEAHLFCPERSGGRAESTDAVVSLMSQGRKRGFCGVLATQRLSKLSKDAAAEANNVMVGRTWLDVDAKRAMDVLGNSVTKPDLRDLKPGCFYTFGPAMWPTSGVREVKIGEAMTTHPKAGQRGELQVRKPSEVLKKLLPEFERLTERAEQEIQDLAAAQTRIRQLEAEVQTEFGMSHEELQDILRLIRRLQPGGTPPPGGTGIEVDWIVQNTLDRLRADQKHIETLDGHVDTLNSTVNDFQEAVLTAESISQERLESLPKDIDLGKPPLPLAVNPNPELIEYHKPDRKSVVIQRKPPLPQSSTPDRAGIKNSPDFNGQVDQTLAKGPKAILTALAQYESVFLDQKRVAMLTGYSWKSGTFKTYLSKLRTLGYIVGPGTAMSITGDGATALGPFKPLPTGQALAQYWYDRLDKGPASILRVLVEHLAETVHASGTFKTYLSKLRTLALIEGPGTALKPAEILNGRPHSSSSQRGR